MKAFVTSIGEPTTALCVWALERNGFDVELISDKHSLWEKMRQIILFKASEDFLRVDADVIVNRRLTPDFLKWLDAKNDQIWWWQFVVFDWLKLDVAHTISYIKKDALPALAQNIDKFEHSNRPETMLSRIAELYEPRRFETYSDELVGLHGYKADLNRSRSLKHVRNQTHLYDFEMAERLNEL